MPLRLQIRLLPVAVVALAAGGTRLGPAEAGVVVLGNRTDTQIDFMITRADGSSGWHRLEPRDVLPLPVADKARITYDTGEARQRNLLQAGSIYYFVVRDKGLQLGKVALPPPAPGDVAAAAVKPDVPIAPAYTIPVMLLVDDDEPAVRRIWERRLRGRLTDAAEIIQRHCGVRFEVVAVGTWDSDNRIVDFAESLREFEREVNPAPARLAIGFTSQYKTPPRRRIHLGGTRGALHSHILIREWAQHVTTTERLEVLLHELGHYLGAAHSVEGDSVMRPTLGDGRAHARSFRIGFDPLNTFIIYLVGEELRGGRHRGFSRFPPHTKAQLRSAYLAMAKLMPEDQSTKNYLRFLDQSPPARAEPARHPKPLVEATRVVVRAIGEAARRNNSLPTGPTGRAENALRLSGDRLTEHYVRRGAAAAGELQDDVAAKAFLLGLGIALDNSTTLRYLPLIGQLCREVESSQQRYERLKLLGSPTMRGRPDLTRHFAVSCALTVLIGPQPAETAGIGKELIDARGRSGFSFVDLSADLAGVTFATHIRDAKIPLDALAGSFVVKDFLPEGTGLEEGIIREDFFRRYGSAQDQRFLRQTAAIRNQILALRGYRSR